MGFLSLICSKNSLESDEPTQVHRKKRLKPLIPISRKNLQVSNPLSESQKTTPEPSDPPPSPSVVANTQSTNTGNTGSSATQVCDNYYLFVYLYRMGWISDWEKHGSSSPLYVFVKQ